MATAATVLPGEPSRLGHELQALATLAWPIALAQLGVMSMGLVDLAVLGHASTYDFAGAAMGRTIGFAAITLAMGVATGLEPVASQALGANERGRAWSALGTNLKTSLLVAVPCVAAAFLASAALPLFGVNGEVTSLSRAYLIGQVPAMLLTACFIAGKGFLQAHGRTAPALAAALIANVVNFVVCNLLVRGDGALLALGLAGVGLPGLGALGAGLALSIASSVLAGVVLLSTRRHRAPADGAPFTMKRAWTLGAPIGMQMLAEYAVFSVVAFFAAGLGPEIVAAHQIALSLASFTYMGALGIGGATAVRVGLAVGAGRSPRRAGLLGLGVGAAYMSVCAAVFAVFPEELVSNLQS